MEPMDTDEMPVLDMSAIDGADVRKNMRGEGLAAQTASLPDPEFQFNSQAECRHPRYGGRRY